MLSYNKFVKLIGENTFASIGTNMMNEFAFYIGLRRIIFDNRNFKNG